MSETTTTISLMGGGHSYSPARLREARHEAGITLYELQKRSGIAHSSIKALEDGTTLSPRKKTLRALEKALDLPKGHLSKPTGYPLYAFSGLNDALEGAGLTPEEAASAIGVHPTAIHSAVEGKAVTEELMGRIARVLGTDPEGLGAVKVGSAEPNDGIPIGAIPTVVQPPVSETMDLSSASVPADEVDGAVAPDIHDIHEFLDDMKSLQETSTQILMAFSQTMRHLERVSNRTEEGVSSNSDAVKDISEKVNKIAELAEMAQDNHRAVRENTNYTRAAAERFTEIFSRIETSVQENRRILDGHGDRIEGIREYMGEIFLSSNETRRLQTQAVEMRLEKMENNLDTIMGFLSILLESGGAMTFDREKSPQILFDLFGMRRRRFEAQRAREAQQQEIEAASSSSSP